MVLGLRAIQVQRLLGRCLHRHVNRAGRNIATPATKFREGRRQAGMGRRVLEVGLDCLLEIRLRILEGLRRQPAEVVVSLEE